MKINKNDKLSLRKTAGRPAQKLQETDNKNETNSGNKPEKKDKPGAAALKREG